MAIKKNKTEYIKLDENKRQFLYIPKFKEFIFKM